MTIWDAVQIYGSGTPEGARKAWDTRGRKEKELSERAQRAIDTYVPLTPQKLQMAKLNERKVAQAVNGVSTADNSPFDVLIRGRVGLEVKTLLNAGNDKLTMHPESLERKQQEAKRMGLEKLYTIAIDQREGASKIFYKEGLGSFRLASMTEVPSFSSLRRIVA